MNQALDLPSADKYGERPRFRWIDKTKLVIDHRYQRSIETRRSQNLIRHIRENWSWKCCPPLDVTDNGDGTYCVFDGQHRWAAASMIPDITELPCWVRSEMSLQEQAMAFVNINTHRVAVTPVAVHHAKAKAGDPIAREMDAVAHAAGCFVSEKGGDVKTMKQGEFVCLSTVKKGIKDYGPGLVTRALRLVRDSASDCGGIRSEILAATIDLLAEKYPEDALAKHLKLRRPDQLIAHAYAMRAQDPVRSLTTHVKAILQERWRLGS